MKPSTMTLAGALCLLPKVIRNRYQDDSFGKVKGNAVLSDIEKAVDAEYYKSEFPLILLDGVTEYELNPNIRHVRGLYQINLGDIVPDKDNPISFEIIGNAIRLFEVPIASTEDDIDSDVTGPDGTKLDRFKDTVELGSLTENSLTGTLCEYLDFSLSRTIYKIVKGNDPANKLCILNGVLPEVPADTDSYKIYYNYYLIDALRYITRLTATSSVIDIPQDWEEAFLAGLRYYYENQTDQESSKYRRAAEEYLRLLRNLSADEKRKIGAHPKPIPRSMPDIASHYYDA